MGCTSRLALWFLLGLLLAEPVAAQRRRQQEIPRARLQTEATIKGVRPGFLHVVTQEGEQWLVKVEARPQDITYLATAHPRWLRPGMPVRFSGKFDRRGQAEGTVTEIAVYAPRQGQQFGVTADALPGGQDLFAKEKPKAKVVPKTQTLALSVLGKLVSLKNGKMTVAAGTTVLKAELAEDAQVSVDMADYSLARPGDKVELEAWYLPAMKGQAVATRLKITAAQPLGLPSKPRAELPAAAEKKARTPDK